MFLFLFPLIISYVLCKGNFGYYDFAGNYNISHSMTVEIFILWKLVYWNYIISVFLQKIGTLPLELSKCNFIWLLQGIRKPDEFTSTARIQQLNTADI